MKHKLSLHLAFLAFLILLAGMLSAQDNDEKEYTSDSDEIVISASGYPRPLTSTTGGIGIITSEEIMKRDPVSISDAMQDITGVYKTADSSWGSEISIRGATRDKVVMIIDGSRLNTATDIGAQFGTVNPASIERVEVLKGPVSSLYGSGSIGGIVNIFTRTGRFSETPQSDSGIILSGENNSTGVNTYGYTSYNSSGWYAFGSGSYRSHENYSDGDGDEVENSGFNDAEGTLNLGFKPAAGHTVELRSQYYQGWDIGIPGARDSVPVTASSAEYTKMRRGLLSADYKIIPDSSYWLETKFHLYWQYLGRDVEINNAVMKIEPGADHNTTGAQWTNIFGLGNSTIVAGADTWMRTIETWRTKTNTATGDVTEDTPIPDARYLSSG
ncbi:MAG TPA: TonB-dependent receptor plug domain-containing protein, partial [Spirochaetota bacterium]|nr:TonB-dependent receptor plug domain-containing protein [Spirochaetota bacterium]